MATLSWERGNFGLTSLNLIGDAFNGLMVLEFDVKFNEARNERYVGISQQSDTTFTDVSQQSDPTLTAIYPG